MLKKRKTLLYLAPPLFVLGMVIAAVFATSSKTTVTENSSVVRSQGASAGGSIPLVFAPAQASFAPTPTPTPEPTAAPTPTPEQVRAATNQSRISQAPAPKPTSRPAPTPQPTSRPVSQPQPTPQPTPKPATCGGTFNEKFLCLLNEYRASKGKGKLGYSSSLAKVALSHSTWMNSTGTFSHAGEEGSRFFDRCKLAGIACRAENLALGAGSAENLLTMWKNSSGHNANLLGPYTTIGLGTSGSYITALFN